MLCVLQLYLFVCCVLFFYLCFESTVNFPFYVLDSLKSIHSKQPNINETTKRKRMLLTTYYSRCFHVWTFNFQLSSLCFEVSNMGCFLCRFVCIKKNIADQSFRFWIHAKLWSNDTFYITTLVKSQSKWVPLCGKFTISNLKANSCQLRFKTWFFCGTPLHKERKRRHGIWKRVCRQYC